MSQQWLRYRDLKAEGIVSNRATLGNWIRDRGFPSGRLIGPNTRMWPEDEVRAWIDSRPTEFKQPPPNPRRKRKRARARRSPTRSARSPDGKHSS
jgi:predicted DNA-binding transcriptional regulator AlpA